ncbi:glycerophosphodiester phosphodiesterase 1 [Macrosteles quadrilineatus]|uniref:glycerophosphodiester phosphodiesterase 1 n=1 Tax=Macrosteles quadrilineatus TaxID=74068 RepID=UPI0023E0A581|nr:glycerophosphodiester phosphodiesterase 1 [Macrosteles quadrilineatus]
MKFINKPFSFDIGVFTSCFMFWSSIYCFIVLFFETISLSVFSGVLLTIIVLLTYGTLWSVAVPQPDPALVKEILGSDPKLMRFRKSNSSLSGEEEQVEDDKEYFTVIGHRGAGLDAPENSLSAIRQCHDKGCKAVEFDLVLTADGVPVLFHDDTVDRITNSSGVVQQMTWDQLRALDISEKHPLQERFIGERVPLFSDVIKLCLELDMRMIIDVKDESTKTVEVILAAFKEHPKLYKRAIVSGFNPFLIYMVRSKDPGIVCSLAWRPYYYSLSSYGRDVASVRRHSGVLAHVVACAADVLGTWLLTHVGYHTLGLSAVLLHKDVITSDLIAAWEKKKVRVIAWTVNRPQEKVFFRHILQVAYITDTLVSETTLQ